MLMIGNMSIDLSLKNIWNSWFEFKKGKKYNLKMHDFQYNLEKNLYKLFFDLKTGNYKHGEYDKFTVCDNKKREISVCPIRDRIIHRLLYDYLCKIYDKTFIYDAWSCRKGKGLFGATKRTQKFLEENPQAYIWKVDIRKFFDSVDHAKLKAILRLKIKDRETLSLLDLVIGSFGKNNDKGIPIGNLTSQIFANIYLNELDRFIKHKIKPKSYLRYGDDFILIENNLEKLNCFQEQVTNFINGELYLTVNCRNNFIVKAKRGLKFLGAIIDSKQITLNRRNKKRIFKKLNLSNLSSYYGIIRHYGGGELQKRFNYTVLNLLIT